MIQKLDLQHRRRSSADGMQAGDIDPRLERG